jgi:GTPase SAR1 family protein
VDNAKVDVQIWDTAGQETHHSLGPIYYGNASGAIAVFEVGNPQSLGEWIKSFREVTGLDAVAVIVGNKIDDAGPVNIGKKDAECVHSRPPGAEEQRGLKQSNVYLKVGGMACRNSSTNDFRSSRSSSEWEIAGFPPSAALNLDLSSAVA